MNRDKQINSSDWLIKSYTKEELARMKAEAIKEAEIEEMRNDVERIHRCFLEDDDYDYLDEYIAIRLFKKGYRKASEVAEEIFEEIEKWRPITKLVIQNVGEFDFHKYGEKFYWVSEAKLAELKKKYESEKDK